MKDVSPTGDFKAMHQDSPARAEMQRLVRLESDAA